MPHISYFGAGKKWGQAKNKLAYLHMVRSYKMGRQGFPDYLANRLIRFSISMAIKTRLPRTRLTTKSITDKGTV